MLLELDGLRDCGSPASPAECIVRKYTWGLDLAGQNGQINSLESAGAISGLLAAYDPAVNRPLWYFYDANGNVGQVLTMISVGGANYDILPAARYEYDPYGNRVNEPAANEYEQPLRFSTKQWDPETGLLYFGLRYRDRERWISRDPIHELGFVVHLLEVVGEAHRIALATRASDELDHLLLHSVVYFERDARRRDRDTVRNEVGVRNRRQGLYEYALNNPCGQLDPLGDAVPAIVYWAIRAYIIKNAACIFVAGSWSADKMSGSSNDKYRHCHASCAIQRACAPIPSFSAGVVREMADELEEWLGREPGGWDWADIFANVDGYNCAGWETWIPIIGRLNTIWREDCDCCCARLHCS